MFPRCKASSLSFLYFSKFFLTHFALFALLFEQFVFSARASDLPITPDGSTNTQVTAAPNGVVVVNIAATDPNGNSTNHFTDLNVNRPGLIFNNSIGSQNNTILTNLGGLVTDNPNLVSSGAAAVILAEVTSGNISEINGAIEIAGKKADLIIANPNGIVMNGAGFINVGRLTAVVGSVNGGNVDSTNLTFSLSGNAYQATHGFLPQLTIVGAGLDVSSVNNTDLVANLMNIVAPISGGNNEINLRAGDNNFNYFTKEVTSNATAFGAPTQLAIDASALAKIQAGKIFIIATKEGFGVRYSADMLASRSGIVIDAVGNVEYKNVSSSAGDIAVTSRLGSIAGNGTIQTKSNADNIILDAATDIVNLGSILGKNNITLTAATLTNFKDIIADNNLTINAPQITNGLLGTLAASNQITITATDFLTNNHDIISKGGLLITAKTLNNFSQIKAQNDATINANVINNNVANNSSIIALHDLNLNVNNLYNESGSIKSGNNLTLRNLSVNAPTIASLFYVSSAATTIGNSGGSIIAAASINMNLGSAANYTITGTLNTTGFIDITANNITNEGSVNATSYIKLTAANNVINGFSSGSGNANVKLAAGTYLDITAANLINNYATISAATTLTLTSTNSDINNIGGNAKIIGGSGLTKLSALNGNINNAVLYSAGLLAPYSFLDASDNAISRTVDSSLSIQGVASFFDSSGNLKTNFSDNISADPNIKTFAKILVNGDYKYFLLDKTDANLANKLRDFYAITNSKSGNIVANQDLEINAINLNNFNRIDVARDFTANLTQDLNNNAEATIYSGRDMMFNVANNFTNNQGDIFANNNLTIRKDNTDSMANQFNNISGNITAYLGDITIRVKEFNNIRASIKTQGSDFVYGSAYVRDECSRDWKGKQHCHAVYEDRWGANVFGTNSKKSSIKSGGNLLTIDVENTVLNDASEIISSGGIAITATNLNNKSTSLRSYRQNIYDNTETLSSSIKSGLGIDTSHVTNNISNTAVSPNQILPVGTIDGQTGQLVNSLDTATVLTLGIINIDIIGYLNGPDNQGLFTKNPNPTGPLFETRSQFID